MSAFRSGLGKQLKSDSTDMKFRNIILTLALGVTALLNIDVCFGAETSVAKEGTALKGRWSTHAWGTEISEKFWWFPLRTAPDAAERVSVFPAEQFVLVEAESFTDKGGWCVDQQFMDQMGSPYLLAHGAGVPVEDATTQINLEKGVWNVWVRTYNWTSPWSDKEGPGAFTLSVGGKCLKTVLGTKGDGWEWQSAGSVKVRGGRTELCLHDLTGFDGRCDAVLFTRESSPSLPSGGEALGKFRSEVSGPKTASTREFDFVVVGGGIAGMCAAAAAARNGLSVALVNDRPVLGGNNSSEVRVHLGGSIELGPNPGLGRMIREFGHTRKGNAASASNYEDGKKQQFIESEENITLFAPYRAVAVKTLSDGKIASVTAVHIESGEQVELSAPLFADCTGDGSVGYLAGADWTMGREARSEYGESLAPEAADKMVMGASVQWYSKDCGHKTSFPEFSFGVEFNAGNCEKVTMGEWTWETGMNRDQISEAEKVRDYGLLVVYSNWSYLKNHSGDPRFDSRSLDWVAYIAGKRESRRLLGDYVLSQKDIDGNISHPDASFTTSWSIDLHFPDSTNSARFPGGEFKSATVHNWIYPYSVPYRCLYSRNVDNLFMAGRDISCTHVALGTVRVMRTTGMMGEVVGMAASLCRKYGCSPRGVYEGHLPELTEMMKKGAGRTDVPLSDQHFNEQNRLLTSPADENPERKTVPTATFLSCRAWKDADTLHLSNFLIERTFLWNGGDLVSLEIKDLRSGRTFTNSALGEPSLVVTATPQKATDGTFTARWVSSDGIHPDRLEAEVSYSLGSTKVRRVFRIYPDCPAIACDNYVLGADSAQGSETGNAADNKNIESTSDMKKKRPRSPHLECFNFDGVHWRARAVEFFDVTDWNDNLVCERDFIPYRRTGYRGNLLFARDGRDGNGFFLLKEAPCSSVQLGYPGADFVTEFGKFTVTGVGASEEELRSGGWVKLYSCVVGVFSDGKLSPLSSLRTYQKNIRLHRPQRDEMVMMNTWGDRSQDSKVNEAFCLEEIEKAARLGVTHFQIDDGWQEGKSPNSAVAKGSFKNIWDNPLYWTPAKDKYPRGLAPVVEKAREKGITLGLWFNPSIQNDFEDWEKDADAVVKLFEDYGITVFKIDGVSIPTKKAEENLRRFFDSVLERTGNRVVFNLDVTAGRRGGYHCFNDYGNIFLENRYTDWGNYFPYHTLRNLWQLSRYVPAECLQVEFLNKWRNPDKYASDDPFAPGNYSFEYVFATAMAAQPLAWMEASNLPEEAYNVAPLIEGYKKIMSDFHRGTILPVGEEPSGRSWTGFQSVSKDSRSGYFIVYRELTSRPEASLETFLPEGAEVSFEKILGSGEDFSATAGEGGRVNFSLENENSFAVYRYRITNSVK